jgi:hypothetical protein
MKRILVVFCVLIILAIGSVAYAISYPEDGKVFTYVGKLDYDKKGGFYIIQDKDGNESLFLPSDLKNATPEFRQCIDNGKYKGIVELTSIITEYRTGTTLEINKTATCKRH